MALEPIEVTLKTSLDVVNKLDELVSSLTGENSLYTK